MAVEKPESHVEKLKLKAFRFLTEGELMTAKALAIIKEENPEKIRTTADVEVWVRPTQLANGHRVIEFTSSSPQFVVHSTDMKTILETQQYDVLDLKVRPKA